MSTLPRTQPAPQRKLLLPLAWHKLLLLLVGVLLAPAAFAVDDAPYISSEKKNNAFPLFAAGKAAPFYISENDFPGVIRALKDLQADMNRVTNTEPALTVGKKAPKAKTLVLVGTLGKSPLIDQLVKSKKLDVKDLAGKWETFVVQTVKKPMKGVDEALVIVGSDKRGTIYGIYDVSQQIGVSPWYWWADVPVKQQQNLYVAEGRHTKGTPAVKYRGIFINDEAPALSNWSKEQFGGFNHKFYEKVFELILRMKGNYLWPAMWGNAFSDDDKISPQVADMYGVVMGTSHHEPLARAHAEWSRYGSGPWNYNTNAEKLREFWTGGIKRMNGFENIVTVGMRGDGDEPMSEESNIGLLEKIVADQRKIIADVTGKPASQTPQLWALYKEVQDYYDKGMRVPDDVTLLLADDNWGNIRKLPKPGEKQHSGGYGIYYHFDYVGGPRNYKWINTNPLPRIWEQMHLAYQHKADRIWIVNVGDIKPMEFPTEFFLDYAWNPEKWPAERLEEYTQLWAERQFGAEHAPAIADILAKYAKYNARRKPELLAPNTYSLTNYQEAERIVADYNRLAQEAEQINKVLPAQYRDAYYQLVLFPVQASANLNELHVTTGLNRLYAQQGRATTNELAAKVKALFDRDAELTRIFHKDIAGGKWNHMMSQTHISYTYWQQPEKDVMPEVKNLTLPNAADMGVAIEGSDKWWPQEKGTAVLPEFSPFAKQGHYLEIFNRGQQPVTYSITSGAPWLKVSQPSGTVAKEQRLWVTVDWAQAPTGTQRVPLTITGPNGKKVVVQAIVQNPTSPKPNQLEGFAEANGYVSMEAEHFTRAVNANDIQWKLIPDLGRTGSAMTTLPVTASSQTPGGNSPHLEYKMYLQQEGEVSVQVFLSPTLNFHNTQGLRYAISFDDEAPQIINIHQDKSDREWNKNAGNNLNLTISKHQLKKAGEHVLKFWMVDSGIVLQKIVVDAGGLKPSYLGPPESTFQPVKEAK
ncbi:glycosyl hydrolase 115 family protein [Rufibacter sediminis]|uniref:Glycosyl hydrolase 115 family protein n=1 Tax=Rufibacter sediminis TaxID=2762756 RepID=A0ABR6VNP5_9BACT|nr:glycosyl hydrolase 115 family protein [Rufibacter sediminis]MBC3538820.1 glycosyl hydrolase 115 family protein [Rufibacter sediminis]